MKKTKPVVGVKPTNSQILIEKLNAQEATGTVLTINDDSSYGAPQAYILAVGPAIKLEDAGFGVGDRVILSGNYVPVPNYDSHKRERGLVELHNIKAVLVEEE